MCRYNLVARKTITSLLASFAFASTSFAVDEWFFNGTDAITSGDWKVSVSVINKSAGELATPDWNNAVETGRGDLDLSAPIRDESGKRWKIVELGSGSFSHSYYPNNDVPIGTLILPKELRTIKNYVFDKGITNLVISCPELVSIGTISLNMSDLKGLTLNAPSLPELAYLSGNPVLKVSDTCVLDIDNFCLDSLTNLSVILPRRLSRKGVIRLPSLQAIKIRSFAENQDLTGLVLGGAGDDGSNLRTISSGHISIVKKCSNLEFIVIGSGEGQVFTDWSSFDLTNCNEMKRIFFAGPKPQLKSSGDFLGEPNGANSLCFYIRPDESSWDSVVSKIRALTENEKTIFRERFGDKEPLPLGTVAASVFGTSERQFVSYGDYRSFLNDVIVRTTRKEFAISDLSPRKFIVPVSDEKAEFSIADIPSVSEDGNVKYNYYGYTLETFDGNGWTGGSTTNFSRSVELSNESDVARRLTWHYLPAYKVEFTDRGFLEEYPETFSVEYLDGEPDEEGFLVSGMRVKLSVTGFDTAGNHPGRFVAWDGKGVQSLSGKDSVVEFSVTSPASIFPRVEHQWVYTPKDKSDSGYHEISDGNWRLAANISGGVLNLSGQTGYGWCNIYLDGSGYLDLPTNVVDTTGNNYKLNASIFAETFKGNKNIRGIRLPSTCTSVAVRAFYKSSNVEVLELTPNSLTSIGERAFSELTKLKEVEFVQTNLTGGLRYIFMDCNSLADLKLDIPNVKDITACFYSLPLKCDISDWNITSVTGLWDYVGLGSETIDEQKAWGTLHLNSVKTLGIASIPRTVSAIDFDKAPLTSVSPYWAQWDNSKQLNLNTLIFRGRAPSRNVLDNLLIATPAVDGNKKVTIYCSTGQVGWEALVSDNYTTKERAAAEILKASLVGKERLLGVYETQNGSRKAWLVHRPSPYDKDPLVIMFR